MSTASMSAKKITRNWLVFDASDKVLGRLATVVAKVLMGKNKPSFVPYLDQGDNVVVTNASKVKVTGKKIDQKIYARHSGYPGGFKSETFRKLQARKPEAVIEKAVKGMLPKNRLGRQMIQKLHVFAGNEHPYTEQLGNKQEN